MVFQIKKVTEKLARVKKVRIPSNNKFVRFLKKLLTPATKVGRYFKGSWVELGQVRWPNRSATWSLTLAVLLFSGFFVVLILLLDYLFKTLFNLILK